MVRLLVIAFKMLLKKSKVGISGGEKFGMLAVGLTGAKLITFLY